MFDRQKLKEFLSKKNKSVSAVARELGVTDNAIRNILYGIRQPSLVMTAQFAEMMDCSIDDLVIKEAL